MQLTAAETHSKTPKRRGGRRKYIPRALTETAEYGRIVDVKHNFGLSESAIRRSGVPLVKAGGTTLVDLRALRAFLAALPRKGAA